MLAFRCQLSITSFFLAVLFLLGGCQGGDSFKDKSGESHFGSTRAFLRVCEDGLCESGDDCSCAVCTVTCTEAADCAERILGPDRDPSTLPDSVKCLAPICAEAGDAAVNGGKGLCEVLCEQDADCAFLDEAHEGTPHECRTGRCRTAEAPESPEQKEAVPNPCPAGRLLVPADIAPDMLGFCLDFTEVTVDAFTTCVTEGACEAPDSGNYLTAGRQAHPIHFVTAEQAEAYCAYSGGTLPSRARWQVAAQGGTSSDSFPWGDDEPTTDDLPQRVCALNTTTTCEVDQFAAGLGPFGHADLSGNVAEIVLEAATHCQAGGSFSSTADGLLASACAAYTGAAADVGFRCLSEL